MTEADRGQGFAAKTERRDLDQIVVIELGRGVALDGEIEFLRRHAMAVIGNADQGTAAIAENDIDGRRAGIDGILDRSLTTEAPRSTTSPAATFGWTVPSERVADAHGRRR